MNSSVFPLRQDSDLEALLCELAGRERVEAHPISPLRRLYFDTFDWRLWRAGLVLWCEQLGGRASTVLARPDGAVRRRYRGELELGLADSLPAGAWRDQLEPTLGRRRLLPVVELTGDLRAFTIRDELAKIVARIEAFEPSVAAPEEPRRRRLRVTARVRSVGGFSTVAQSWVERLSERLGVEPGRSEELVDALAAIGRKPGAPRGVAPSVIDGSRPSGAVVRELVGGLRQVVLANLDGCSRDLDPEFLHDLRVAVRRCRALLRQLGGTLPERPRRELERELAWLGRVSGPPRDLDVFAAQWQQSSRSELPAELREALERQRAESHRELGVHLAGPRFAALVELWGRLTRGRTLRPLGRTPAVELATSRIWKAYRRVRKLGGRLVLHMSSSELHRLRIRCKRLRYLMELFRSLYPRWIGTAIGDLKRLQDELGAHHDTQVQEELAIRAAARLAERSAASFDTLLGAGGFLQKLRSERASIEERFEATYRRFTTAATHRRFCRLFGGQ